MKYRKYGYKNTPSKVGPWMPRVEPKADDNNSGATREEALKKAMENMANKFRR